MNPELLTIEVPEHMIKEIQSKLNLILNQNQSQENLWKTRTNDQTPLGKRFMPKQSKKSFKKGLDQGPTFGTDSVNWI